MAKYCFNKIKQLLINRFTYTSQELISIKI